MGKIEYPASPVLFVLPARRLRSIGGVADELPGAGGIGALARRGGNAGIEPRMDTNKHEWRRGCAKWQAHPAGESNPFVSICVHSWFPLLPFPDLGLARLGAGSSGYSRLPPPKYAARTCSFARS